MVRKFYFYPLELRAGITKLLILDLSWNLLTMIKCRIVANLVPVHRSAPYSMKPATIKMIIC